MACRGLQENKQLLFKVGPRTHTLFFVGTHSTSLHSMLVDVSPFPILELCLPLTLRMYECDTETHFFTSFNFLIPCNRITLI